MRNVLLFGTSPLTKELSVYLREDPSINLIGFTVDQKYIKYDTFMNLKVFPFEKLHSLLNMEEVEVLPTIAYSNMNYNRKALFERCDEYGYKIGGYIHPTTVNYSEKIGRGNIILDRCAIRPFSVIGEGNIILGNTVIAHESVVGDFNYFAGSNHMGGYTRIGSNNFLGIASILESTHYIKDVNIIGAGVVMAKDADCNMVVTAQHNNRFVKSNIKMMDHMLMKRGCLEWEM